MLNDVQDVQVPRKGTSFASSAEAQGGAVCPPAAVIFDMDGLMFDTETINVRFWHEAGEKHGFDINEDVLAPCVGAALPTTRRIMNERFGPEFDFDAVRADRIALAFKWIEKHGMPEKPGLRELLAWLKSAGIKKAVATSSPKDFIEAFK